MKTKRLKKRAGPVEKRQTKVPALRFTPTAWAKLLFLRDYGETEVGGFGIAAEDDLLLIEDVQLVKQICSMAHVTFNDASVADFFDRQVDEGRRPDQFARIWIHTHPGDCPLPSGIDEETFERVFGRSNWAIMFILACGGRSYARLRFNTGPGSDLMMPVKVDYRRPFGGCDPEQWEQEYLANVGPQDPFTAPALEPNRAAAGPPDDWFGSWFKYAGGEDVKGATP